MTTTPEPRVQVAEYTVSLLPDDDINALVYALTVQYRGDGRWAVVHLGSCLGADGTWEYGVKEYDRGDAWLREHRFDEETAIRLACEAAPTVTVNGRTAAQAWALRQAGGEA